MIDRYDWRGGQEAMLRFGPVTGPAVVAALPLLEEANRTRAFLVALLRGLGQRGIIGYLPDLPGQGESLRPLADTTLADMRAALAAATEAVRDRHHRVIGVTMRSGALLDTTARLDARWTLAPQDGATVLREWKRLKQAGDGRADKLADDWWRADIVEIAGNRVAGAMLTEIAAPPCPAPARRVVRLISDPQSADARLPGRPLWRSAEPDNDLALADALADDITDWMHACAA